MKKLVLSCIPGVPGVYRFYNQNDALIYIGKAKNLRRRLAQYQNAKRRKAHAKMRKILREARRLEYETCEDELQALILENQLIQNHRPKWNVAGAFSFLYPMIGLYEQDQYLYFCYTTRPELYPNFRFFGAFRSRYRTREGFFALIECLRFIGHAATSKELKKTEHAKQFVKHTYHYGFRQLPQEWTLLLEPFLKGEKFCAVESLALLLLDKPSALVKRKEIQELLHELRRWYQHEMLPLHQARTKCGWLPFPVLQKERDLLFIQFRASSQSPSSIPRLAQLTSLAEDQTNPS